MKRNLTVKEIELPRKRNVDKEYIEKGGVE